MRRILTSAVGLLSGEFLLKWWPNGGDVVLVRSLITTIPVYFAGIGLKDWLAPGSKLTFSSVAFAAAIQETLPWLGAIFAAVYAGYYTRFSSQWTYLAGLYNQIMAAQVATPWDDDVGRTSAYAAWMAGFIEDAEDLHLATKPMYAAVIHSFLEREEVKEAYRQNTVNGVRRLAALEAKVAKVLKLPSPATTASLGSGS